MKSVSFSITRVNRLRRAAEGARMVAEDPDPPPVGSPSDGWFASAYDANDLVRVFDTLWLKAGFALHAYEYRAGSNGNGIIWAVPADTPLVRLRTIVPGSTTPGWDLRGRRGRCRSCKQ